jgi:hypothetical protein
MGLWITHVNLYLVWRDGPIVTIMEMYGILCFTSMVAIQVVDHLVLKFCCGHLTFPGKIPCLLTRTDLCCSKLAEALHIFSHVKACNVWPEGHLGMHGYLPHNNSRSQSLRCHPTFHEAVGYINSKILHSPRLHHLIPIVQDVHSDCACTI